MANPSNFQITPIVENNEINFRSLYLHHTPHGPDQNHINTYNKQGTAAALINWPIYDGPGQNAKVVARAQGLHIYAGNNTLSIVFEVGRFKGSTLQVMGISVTEGEWAIVGGTGEFARATGVISKKMHEKRNDGYTVELAIRALCPLPKGSRSLLTKIGPWGGNGGTFQDITEAPPSRLESITVYRIRDEVVNSIAFSYIDHDDRKRTAGPWGGSGGERYTIELASTESVKEVSGTFGTYKGYKVITSLKFVTNVKEYRHLGDYLNSGKGTLFTVPVQDNGSIVGFFGRGGKYLDAVGVYVHPF